VNGLILLPLTGCAVSSGGPKSTMPFWTSQTMEGESVFFVRQRPETRPEARLLFTPIEILQVARPATGEVYEVGSDYEVDCTRRVIRLPAGSTIPFKEQREMYPLPGESHSIEAHRDGVHHLYFGGGNLFHGQQIEITYTHSGEEWRRRGAPVPTPATRRLPGTMRKLHRGEPLNLVLLGDSISAGADASGTMDTPPHSPPYGTLFADWLRRTYASDVTFHNFSVGGTTSAWGAEQAQQIGAEHPDLVIIAFGMNDASGRVEPEVFGGEIRKTIEAIRAEQPRAEFILVATMSANPEWTYASPSHYQDYLEQLRKLTGRSVALADVTSIWVELLKHKSFADLTGNGVNHPNDFGHRIYAQVLAALLMD